MTFAFAEATVTTWGTDKCGNQIWRARSDTHVVEFIADRLTPMEELRGKAVQALAAQVLADSIQEGWR